MLYWIEAEVPEVNKLSVACAVVGGLKFIGPGITLADKGLGCYLGILDQKIETGRNCGHAAAAVGA
ncbi:hypothetical protein ES703_114363 [subsurface metagenome]